MKIDRIDGIKALLLAHGRVSVGELCERFQTSSVTIRKDLSQLEDDGFLKRVYGGAVLTQKSQNVLHIDNPTLSALADAACEEIHDGDSIFIGSGRTCCYLAKRLKAFEHLAIVTNNITALQYLPYEKFRIYLLGGEVTSVDNRSTMFSSPENPKAFISSVYVNKAFTSVSGIDMLTGLTVNSVISTYIYHQLPSIARSWYLMADYNKFDHIAMHPVAALSDIAGIVSDKIPEAYQQEFRRLGIKMRLTR